MRRTLLSILLVISTFIWLSPLVEAAPGVQTGSSGAQVWASGTVSETGATFVSSSLELGASIQSSMNTWYQKNNILVSFLPELPPVHKVDAIAVLLGVFLVFWSILRFLSK